MLDYNGRLRDLQRLGPQPSDRADAGIDRPVSKVLRRIDAIGKYSTNQATQPTTKSKPRPDAEPVFIGLAGRMIPTAFRVLCHDGRLEFSIGTWSTDAKQSLATRWEMLSAAFGVSYPSLSIEAGNREHVLAANWRSGYVLGAPSFEAESRLEVGTHLDRLVQAVGKGSWGFLVLAMPAVPTTVHAFRGDLLDELEAVSRVVHGDAGKNAAPEPAAEHYMSIVKKSVEMFSAGVSVGMWRVGVYLFGDPVSYYRLAGVWPGVFAGEESVPDSVRVMDDARALGWATDWNLPSIRPVQDAAGQFRHPLAYQSIITSSQLAAYCSLPTHEVYGLRVRRIHRLDLEPPATNDHAVRIGRIVADHSDDGAPTPDSTSQGQNQYSIDPMSIREHVFVAGVTGAGKTNTVFSLLRGFAAWRVPFLVIEPAKAEYRRLLDAPWAQGLRPCVYTPGNVLDEPLRINPFEVLGGEKRQVSVHIDMLRSLFTASFGLWSPLPEILERCLHEIYADAGWDAVTNVNHRVDRKLPVLPSAFPTMTDLVNKVEEVIADLGYERETSDRMRAALLTRLNSLRGGAKGDMLDCQVLTNMEEFLTNATVLELEHLGSDEDRAFVMGLLIIRLAEHLRAMGQSDDLRQVLVIEEAHRLLGQTTGPKSQEQGDPRAKAVESFSNLLAEVRAYGLAIVVVDQSPTALAPSVMRNTSLKVGHRLLAVEDRNALAGAMGISESESNFFSSIPNHFAAFFAKGDDRPIMVRVDKAKPDSDPVARRRPAPQDSRPRQIARKLSSDPLYRSRFGALVLGIADGADFVPEPWSAFTTLVLSRCPPDVPFAQLLEESIIELGRQYARLRGRQFGWSLAETADFSSLLERTLKVSASGKPDDVASRQFSELYSKLFVRRFDPYPSCSSVCSGSMAAMCRYRHAISDIVPDRANSKIAFEQRLQAIENSQSGVEDLYSHCAEATSALTLDETDWRGPADWRSRILLCFAQQMLEDLGPAQSSRLIELMIDETNEVNHDRPSPFQEVR